MASYIARRKFLATLGGAAAAWPLAARAQQAAMPVVGYLNLASPESDASRLTGLRRGLIETGYVEGRNLVIEYRFAGYQAGRLSGLAADLVRLQVTVIVAAGPLPALATKAATTSIPIVFGVGVASGIRPRRFGLRCSRYRSDLCGTRLHNEGGNYRAQKESRMPRPASPSPAPRQRAATQPPHRREA